MRRTENTYSFFAVVVVAFHWCLHPDAQEVRLAFEGAVSETASHALHVLPAQHWCAEAAQVLSIEVDGEVVAAAQSLQVMVA
jgi:hypothetical protein